MTHFSKSATMKELEDSLNEAWSVFYDSSGAGNSKSISATLASLSAVCTSSFLYQRRLKA